MFFFCGLVTGLLEDECRNQLTTSLKVDAGQVRVCAKWSIGSIKMRCKRTREPQLKRGSDGEVVTNFSHPLLAARHSLMGRSTSLQAIKREALSVLNSRAKRTERHARMLGSSSLRSIDSSQSNSCCAKFIMCCPLPFFVRAP